MVSVFGLGIQQIILIIIIILVISFIFFRRYFSALVLDYVVDGGLSFADNFIAGAGLIGLDFGDWIAAVIIFKREKKITGKFFAGLAAWEATNLIPLSFIPVFGEMLEVTLGFVPTVFILRVIFNKYGKADKKKKKLETEVSIAEQLGIRVSHEKKVLKQVKRLIRKADPVDALKMLRSKKPTKEISSKLRDYVDNLIAETDGIIQYIAKQNVNAPQNMINILQQGINQAGQLLQQAQDAEENEDFETAINSAMQAKKVIISAGQEFDNAFREYQNQMQQGQLRSRYA